MGEVSVKRAEKIYSNLIVHDDGIIGKGGQFVDLVGPFGVGKSTLLMQMAQQVRHLDYNMSKRMVKQKKMNPEDVKTYPETVIMRGLSDDHWNTLIPKNWKASYPNYGKPKILRVHVHEEDNYEFFEVSHDGKRKINSQIKIYTYSDAEELFDNIRPGAINVVYEPSDYYLSTEILHRFNRYKLKAHSDDEDGKKIPAESAIFWYDFIETLCRETRGAFCTLILDEFHLVVPAYMQGDLFHAVTWFTHNMIDMRKNNISMFVSTHDENLIDYRIKERIMTKIWLRGAVPKNTMVKLSVLRNLEEIGEAVIEDRNLEFGKFPFDAIPNQPPLLKARVNGSF